MFKDDKISIRCALGGPYNVPHSSKSLSITGYFSNKTFIFCFGKELIFSTEISIIRFSIFGSVASNKSISAPSVPKYFPTETFFSLRNTCDDKIFVLIKDLDCSILFFF